MEYIHLFVIQFAQRIGLNSTVSVFGNTLTDYAVAVFAFLLAYGAFKLLQVVIVLNLKRLSARTATDLDDTFVKMVESFRPPFYAFLAFWLALRFLDIYGITETLITGALIIWAVYQVVIAVGIFVEDILLKKVASDSDPTTQSAMRLLSNIVKGAIWGLGIILALSNLGVDVTSLLAGVGIGGIAIAFALQGILSDLFSSFSIYFDKPFKIGDFIIVDDKKGTVKHIGIKSTRLTALSGEEIILSNKHLTSAQVHNYKQMMERRCTFSLGVTYDTPSDKLRRANEIIKDAIEKQDAVRFDRVHFKEFADSALVFEVVYYILSGDYSVYMNTNQEINFSIKEEFEKEGIEFAFPTQTLHVVKESV
jgi:small-conductance mechanosensitive channel